MRIYLARYRAVNRERLSRAAKVYKKAYYQQHRVRLGARQREYWARNKERLNAAQAVRYAAHRDINLAKSRAWRCANQLKLLHRRREWHKHHPESQAHFNAKKKQETATIHEKYARQLLSGGTRIPKSQWPIAIVQLKQTELQLKRKLKELCQNRKM